MLLEYYVIQFELWLVVSSVFLLAADFDDKEHAWLFTIYNPKNTFNVIKSTSLRFIWVLLFTTIITIIVFPIRLWFWANALPFKLVLFLFTLKTNDSIISKIFIKDKNEG